MKPEERAEQRGKSRLNANLPPHTGAHARTADHLRGAEVGRSGSYGAAAVCLAVLLGVLQIGITSDPLRVAVLAASIGAPLWVAMATGYDSYVSAHPSTAKGHTAAIAHFLGPLFVISGLCLTTAVGAVAWHLDTWAGIAFASTSVVALVFGYRQHESMEKWIHTNIEKGSQP
jgi:cobalamin synthase